MWEGLILLTVNYGLTEGRVYHLLLARSQIELLHMISNMPVNSGTSVKHYLLRKNWHVMSTTRYESMQVSKPFRHLWRIDMTLSYFDVMSDNLWRRNSVNRDDALSKLNSFDSIYKVFLLIKIKMIGLVEYVELNIRHSKQAKWWKWHFRW